CSTSACRCGSSEQTPSATEERAIRAFRAILAAAGRTAGRTVPPDCGGGRRRHGPGPSILGLCEGPEEPHPIPQKPSQPSPFPLHPENHQSLANLLPPHWPKAGEPKREHATTTGLDLPGSVPKGIGLLGDGSALH
ncbi:RIKEN cDNA 6330419J24, partial [Mus musculus]